MGIENYGFKETNVNLAKIELNSQGDYVVVSTDDPTLLDRFVDGYKRIVELSNSIPAKLEEIEKQYEGKEDYISIMEKTVAMSRVNVGFSEEAVTVVNGIFNDDIVKKHFRSVYEEIPDFLPDADCFITMLEKMIPIMEKIFGQKIKRLEKSSKDRMAKYKPQDHKKPKRKRASK